MKHTYTFLVFIFLSCQVCAQKSNFIRVYDFDGRKIIKGKVILTTDSTVHLKVNASDTLSFPIHKIGTIKTKRSGGHSLLVGTATVAGLFALIGVASADPDAGFLAYTALEGAGLGAFLGAPLGAAFGGIAILLKNSKKFEINGDVKKWEYFQDFMDKR